MVHTYLCPVLSFNQLTFPLKGSKQACFDKVDVEWKFSILLSTWIVLLWLQKHMSFSCSFSVCVCGWRGKDWGISVWLWDKIVSEYAHRGFIRTKTAHTHTFAPVERNCAAFLAFLNAIWILFWTKFVLPSLKSPSLSLVFIFGLCCDDARMTETWDGNCHPRSLKEHPVWRCLNKPKEHEAHLVLSASRTVNKIKL